MRFVDLELTLGGTVAITCALMCGCLQHCPFSFAPFELFVGLRGSWGIARRRLTCMIIAESYLTYCQGTLILGDFGVRFLYSFVGPILLRSLCLFH